MGLLSTENVLVASIVAHLAFFTYGIYQDANLPVPYTDIDYLVFTDAANYVNAGLSPYLRETYRYTPLLAWILTPCARWYEFGKLLFMVSDLVVGVLLLLLLKGVPKSKKLALASVWLLNPMVITISTRGSSEAVLCVFVMAFIYFLVKQKVVLAGLFAGLSIHFKIYPLIYLPTAVIYLTSATTTQVLKNPLVLFTKKTLTFIICTIVTFVGLGWIMYTHYGYEFIHHAYTYHLSRTDHRHNFSLYNMVLYFNASPAVTGFKFPLETLAFIPQLGLSLIVAFLAPRNLFKTLLIQTIVFVTFNKVMTSQYFIWFMPLLPLALADSNLLGAQKARGIFVLVLWIVGQAIWLFFAYGLEFEGRETWTGLMAGSISFFLSNVLVLGVLIDDL